MTLSASSSLLTQISVWELYSTSVQPEAKGLELLFYFGRGSFKDGQHPALAKEPLSSEQSFVHFVAKGIVKHNRTIGQP